MNTENLSPKTNPRHEKFISQMIRHGDKIRAYKAVYPKATDEAARTASSRLMKNPYIKKRLNDVHKEIHIGLANDKIAFIHQELKVINQKRKLLLEIITGGRKATINELMKAIRLDNELAEQQAQLLGYGSMKPLKNVPVKNAESVTKMNNEQPPAQPVQPAEPVPGNDWTEEGYPNGLPLPAVAPAKEGGFVTNGTSYSCNPSPDADMDEPKEYPLLDQLLIRYGFEPTKSGKLHFE